MQTILNKEIRLSIIKWLIAQITPEQVAQLMHYVLNFVIVNIPAAQREATIKQALDTIDQARAFIMIEQAGQQGQ